MERAARPFLDIKIFASGQKLEAFLQKMKYKCLEIPCHQFYLQDFVSLAIVSINEWNLLAKINKQNTLE